MENMEFYKDRGLSYIVGSHMYGLNTEASDTDELTVYFDPSDYIRLYRKHPEVKEMHGNNTKLYSLDYFAHLLVKGNPNLVEVVKLNPSAVGGKDTAVRDFMTLLAGGNEMVHSGVAKAYMGHLTSIVKELDTKGVTPKRLSHALRVCYSVKHILKNKELFILREHESARKDCLYVKLEESTSYCESYVRTRILEAEETYHKHIGEMQDNSKVKELVNGFFEGLYSYGYYS